MLEGKLKTCATSKLYLFNSQINVKIQLNQFIYMSLIFM